jgi:hypothetical protein
LVRDPAVARHSSRSSPRSVDVASAAFAVTLLTGAALTSALGTVLGLALVT